MKFKKAPLFLSMALATSLMAVPAQAAVNTAGGTGETPVTITAEATTFNVTVPTSIPLTVKADGTVGVPSDLKIVNNSAGKVKVTAVTAKDGTWTLADYNGGKRDKLASEKVNAKKLGLQLTAAGASVATTGTNAISTVDSTKWVMDGKDSGKNELPITVGAIATAVSEAKTFADADAAAKVIFTIGWDTQTGTQDVLSQGTQDVLSELA